MARRMGVPWETVLRWLELGNADSPALDEPTSLGTRSTMHSSAPSLTPPRCRPGGPGCQEQVEAPFE